MNSSTPAAARKAAAKEDAERGFRIGWSIVLIVTGSILTAAALAAALMLL